MLYCLRSFRKALVMPVRICSTAVSGWMDQVAFPIPRLVATVSIKISFCFTRSHNPASPAQKTIGTRWERATVACSKNSEQSSPFKCISATRFEDIVCASGFSFEPEGAWYPMKAAASKFSSIPQTME